MIIDHRHDHIIAHADAEEKGLYLEIKENYPKLEEKVIQLIIDHDLLRDILAKIEENKQANGSKQERLSMYESLLIVNWHHSRDEEKFLLAEPEA